MRNYYGREIKDEEVRECLASHYPTTTEKGRWDTPFGISFAEPGYNDKKYTRMGWLYIYNSEGSSLCGDGGIRIKGYGGGWPENQEILHLVAQFDKAVVADFSVYKKPQDVLTLESLYDVKATLHPMYCLQWCISTDWFACINNPFDTCRANASGESEFEVVFHNEEELHDHVHISHLFDMLRQRGFIPIPLLCKGCGVVSPIKPLRKCTRCRIAFYCSKECQTNDWLPNHKAICK